MNVDVVNLSQCFMAKKKILNDTEKDSKNAFLNVVPSHLKFIFSAENLKVQEETVHITNYFPKPCPVRILSLETHYFQIGSASRKKWLSPGSVFKIKIRFVPNEMRDYNDVLRISYFDDQTLQIKITATVTSNFFFPTNINFGNVPLGQAACYKIPIHSSVERKFSFAILPSKEDPCVDIYPRCGHVKPKQEPVIVIVIYRPLQYITTNFQIRIFISDICKTPYVINFYACTRPGFLRETLENVELEIKNKIQLAKTKNAIPRSKIKPISPEKIVPKFNKKKSTIVCTNLYALHTVNCILNSKIQKPYDEHELKGPLNEYMSRTIKRKAQKLQGFLMKVENYRQQNERVKIHHKSKVCHETCDINEVQIIQVKTERKQEWNDYKDSMKTSLEEVLLERQEAKKIKQRILRVAQKYPNIISMSPQNGQYFFRYCKVIPFLQIIRKIILRNRLLKVLAKLRYLTPELVVEFTEPIKEN